VTESGTGPNYGWAMQDRAVVAAVVAGDADGFGAAYDQYAASLYAYCHSVLPPPEAAEAVLDTFLIAAAKLDGLGDPDRLGAWLRAVARNECLRRLGPAVSEVPRLGKLRSADLDDELPAVTLPAGLRGKVLAACLDRTPTGRAYRMSVAHRAGTFGPAGFPKAIGPSGPLWWRRARRHPGRVSAIAMLAALVVSAVITVIVTAGGGAHRPQDTGAGLAAQGPAPASSAAPGGAGRPSPAPSATRKATASAAPVLAGASRPASPPERRTPPASPSPSPSPSPSSPAPGYLQVAPDQVMLTSKAGKPVSGGFALTAANGPVSQYTVRVAAKAGRVSVTPMAGSLPVNGLVQVTVTVTSKTALTTQIVVEPGNLSVTVVYKPKPPPPPPPPPSPGNG
jgi:hypothetical protein